MHGHLQLSQTQPHKSLLQIQVKTLIKMCWTCRMSLRVHVRELDSKEKLARTNKEHLLSHLRERRALTLVSSSTKPWHLSLKAT